MPEFIPELNTALFGQLCISDSGNKKAALDISITLQNRNLFIINSVKVSDELISNDPESVQTMKEIASRIFTVGKEIPYDKLSDLVQYANEVDDRILFFDISGNEVVNLD